MLFEDKKLLRKTSCKLACLDCHFKTISYREDHRCIAIRLTQNKVNQNLVKQFANNFGKSYNLTFLSSYEVFAKQLRCII